jgi:hypothetical protein
MHAFELPAKCKPHFAHHMPSSPSAGIIRANDLVLLWLR